MAFWRAAPRIAALLAVVCVINVFSTLHEAARHGEPLAPWEPVTWEVSSAIASFCACAVIWLALRLAPPGRGRWTRFVVGQAVGVVVFSAVHVGGMVALRVIVYAVAGERYRFAPADILYEFRKDVLAYAGFAALLWLAPRLATQRPGPPPAAPTAAPMAVERREDCFDIHDGARLLRVPVGEIIAVRAAGNYVEFLLGDGRRPLMRASLAEIEAALGVHGFLRTHRSWIVNPARVRAIEPSGSGDHRLALDGGETATVSRRFPAALGRLRGER
jgi:DNA-binding LytR/AlgR family response regulator